MPTIARSLALSVVFVATAGAAGCARVEDSRSNAAAVLHGARSANAGVVAIVNPAELCSAYLIAPNLVLTARHCVSTVGGPGTTTACSPTAGPNGTTLQPATPVTDYAPAEITVFTSARLPFTSTGGLAVAEVIVLPDSQNRSLCGNDLALVRLATPIDGATVIPPRLDSPPVVGELLTVVGYGQTGGGDPNTAGTRMEVAGSTPQSVGVTLDGSGVTRTSEGEWVIDTGPCSGDSGSPAIDANGRSVGVMSRGRGAACVGMVYERVDVHADWLRASTLAATAAAGIPAPEWAAPASDAGTGDAAVATGDAADGGSGSSHGGCDASGARRPAGASSVLALLALAGLRVVRRRRA